MSELIWESTLDHIYRITVTRVDQYNGTFRIHKGDQLLKEEPVTLAYGAPFGPDAADVQEWEDKAVVFIDSSLVKP